MDKNELEISIKNIGSIKNASFSIKDLTGILGLPNSGKSYALRSIYWFLQLLDKNRYLEIKNMIKKNMLYYDIINFISNENNKNMEEVIKDKVSKYMNSAKSVKKLNQHEIIYQDDLQLEFHLNTDVISKLIKIVFKKTMMGYLNTNILNSIKINGMGMDKIINEIKLDILKGKDNIFPIETFESLYMPPLMQGYNKHLETAGVLTRSPIRMTIDNIKYNFLADNVSMNFNLKLIADTNSVELLAHNFREIESEIIFNDADLNNSYTRNVISKISSKIRAYITDFYLNSIKLYISDLSGLGSIKFIPYGRNIIVQLYNNSKSIKTDIFEPNNVLHILQNLKNAPFSSYFKWVDEGSKSIDNVNENVKSLFQFMIKGRIDFDSNSGGFKYIYSKDKYVDLNLSSAMVEEIAGIMLPIISSREGDLIIIEEPEAQLHITTQIIMGILLVYIVKEMNIKILFSTHSDTMTFIIQHILSNNIQDNDIKKLMQTIYNNNDVPIPKLNTSDNKMAKKFSFYYISEGKSQEYKSKDLQNSIPGISNVIDDLFNWAFNSLKDSENGDKN